jgi:3-phenylpropionate/cinnamic acid dioxygenase small subunit
VTSADFGDRAAIQDLLARYARALDLRDFDAVGACFTPDAHAEYSGVVLEPGVESILRHLRGISSIPASTHLIGNVLIDFHRDVADVSSQAVVHLVLSRGEAPRVRVRGLFYRDRVVRQDGAWRIAERIHRADWSVELQQPAATL